LGRILTIVRNGVKTIDHVESPGITGGALDSNEGSQGRSISRAITPAG
jgi:hypothetical protein